MSLCVCMYIVRVEAWYAMRHFGGSGDVVSSFASDQWSFAVVLYIHLASAHKNREVMGA